MVKKWCPWCDQHITEIMNSTLQSKLQEASARVKSLEQSIREAYLKTEEIRKKVGRKAEARRLVEGLMGYLNEVVVVEVTKPCEVEETVQDPDHWEETPEYQLGQKALVLRSNGKWTPCVITNVAERGYGISGDDEQGCYEKFVTYTEVLQHLKHAPTPKRFPSTKVRAVAAVKSALPPPTLHAAALPPSDRKKFLQLEGYIRSGTVKAALKFTESSLPYDAMLEGGKTLLHIAAGSETYAHGDARKVLQMLATQQAMRARDDSGNTPLLVAVRRGRVSMTCALVRLGADVAALDHEGVSGLILAAASDAWERNAKVVGVLNTAAVRGVVHKGDSALHVAIKEDHPDIVRYLTLQTPPTHRFPIHAPNAAHHTPVDLVLRKRDRLTDWATLLLEWNITPSLISSHFPSHVVAAARRRVDIPLT